LKNGFYLSFGKYLLRNPELGEVFKNIPDDRFFLETDTVEENLTDVYLRAAQSKSYTQEQIEQIVAENFQKVFIQTT
jgi:TatD DNase family protein